MAKPNLQFIFRDQSLYAVLIDGGQEMDRVTIPMKGHLDEVLIPELDAFLKRNKIDPLVLGRVTITTETTNPEARGVDRNSSAYRIVHTWAAALKAAQNHNK